MESQFEATVAKSIVKIIHAFRKVETEIYNSKKNPQIYNSEKNPQIINAIDHNIYYNSKFNLSINFLQ